MEEKPGIDVIIPTTGQRVTGCIAQVKSALWQGVSTRVTVAMPGELPKLVTALSPVELERVRLIKGAPQGQWGHPAVSYCLEGEGGISDWAEWIYVCGDDDCLLPWGLQHLWNYRHGVGMVIGQAMTIHKVNHIPSPTLYGHTMTRGSITGSCVLFNFNLLKTLEKPWWPREGYAGDWFVIGKMMQFPYRIIPNSVYLLAI